MRTFPCCLAWLSLLGACGAGPTEPPHTAAGEVSTPRSEPSPRPAAGREATSDDAEETQAPTAGRCDDGTCSPCGSGICPTGWYCDEKASACSWLAECATKPSCACITRVLGPACKCDAAGGGAKVSCD